MSRSFDPRSCERSLFDALIDARARYGAKKPILEDQERNPLTYTDLLRAAFALGRKIAAMTQPGERVGVMLPASAGAAVDAPRPPCLSRDGGVIAGSPAVDRRAGWIYLGLPVAENIVVGWTALPPSMQAPQAVPRVARP